MRDHSLQRRDFLKLLSLGGAALGMNLSPPRILGQTQDGTGTIVESPDEFGDIIVEKRRYKDFPYEVNTEVLKPMQDKMTVFSRNMWDPERRKILAEAEDLAYRRLVEGKGKIPNQTRLDYALMESAWTYARSGGITYGWQGPHNTFRRKAFQNLGHWDPTDLDMTWENASLAVKHAARFYGASLAGIAELNPLWIYSDILSPTREDRERTIPVLTEGERYEKTKEAWYIPRSMNRVVALAFEENYAGISNSPGRLASAAVGDGYSRMAVTATTLAEFIRCLGYRALPAGNGVGLSIPMAIDAGLGELGRLGLLITPKYGPRVRLAKVITDMPLIPDQPISFGVVDFCEKCMLCAEDCPSNSITKEPRTWEGKSVSNNPGVIKWYIQPESCYDYNGFSCSNCKRVCPFTKPNNSWLHKMIRSAILKRIGPLNDLMVSLDQASGYGRQLPATEFWKMDGSKTITGREKM